MAKRGSPRRTQAVLRYPSHWFKPEELLHFVELTPFSKRWEQLDLTDQDLSLLQTLIMIDPKGKDRPVIEGTDGLRKIRCGRTQGGKRSGYRVCYVYFEDHKTVIMVTIYAKNEKDDIHPSHKAVIRKAIKCIRDVLDSRAVRFGKKGKEGTE